MRSPERSLTTVEHGPEVALHGLTEQIKRQGTIDCHVPREWGVPVSALVEILVIDGIMDPRALRLIDAQVTREGPVEGG